MIHGRQTLNSPAAYACVAVLFMLAFILPNEYKDAVIYIAGILLSFRALSRPVWLAVNRRRIRQEWETAEAEVYETHRESILHGQPHRIMLKLIDSRGRHRSFVAYRVVYCKPRIGETVKVIFDCDSPEDFLMLPEYKHIIFSDIFIGLFLILIGTYGLFTLFLK